MTGAADAVRWRWASHGTHQAASKAQRPLERAMPHSNTRGEDSTRLAPLFCHPR